MPMKVVPCLRRRVGQPCRTWVALLRSSLLMSAVIACLSCTSVGVTRSRPGQAKPENCRLDVYTSPTEVGRPFVVACLIDVRTGTSVFHNTTGAGAVNYARPAACGCGADALIVVQAGTQGDGFWIPRTGSAVVRAIRYKMVKKP